MTWPCISILCSRQFRLQFRELNFLAVMFGDLAETRKHFQQRRHWLHHRAACPPSPGGGRLKAVCGILRDGERRLV